MRMAGLLTVVVLAVAVFAGLPAQAQLHDIKITLPFSFQAEDTVFPAGTYSFDQENPNKKMMIRGTKKDGVFVTTSLPPASLFTPDKTWLVFHKYGERMFLVQLWSHHIGRQFLTSAEEKSLQKEGGTPTEVKVSVKL